MFPAYNPTATYDEAEIPQRQNSAYPVDMVGPYSRRARVEYTSPELQASYRCEWDRGRPIYPNFSRPTGFHSTLPELSQHPAMTEFNRANMGYPSNRSAIPEPGHSQLFVPRWPETETNNTPPMNPVNSGDPLSTEVAALREWALARHMAERICHGDDQELVNELEREYAHGVKRRRSPEPDPGAGPSQCMARSDGRSGEDLPRPITKRRRETGDRATAQRDETQEQRVGRTPADVNSKSKLGVKGLKRTLVAPSQGVYPPHPPGATTTEVTLGPSESRDQAWREGGQRIEDAHDEEETDGERWERLMYQEDRTWKCRGCGGKAFSDRGTLQRHCRSSVHAKKRDMHKCPHCTKKFVRQSGLKRHMKEKHT